MVFTDMNISVDSDVFCRDCGWVVLLMNCNEPFPSYVDTHNWDWWVYCSNKGCPNHEGEGIYQEDPKWIHRRNNE